jgi:hypothetical protein
MTPCSIVGRYEAARRHIFEENNKSVLRHDFPKSHALNILPTDHFCATCTSHGAQI